MFSNIIIHHNHLSGNNVGIQCEFIVAIKVHTVVHNSYCYYAVALQI